jgi:hypothetical protein
MEDMRSGTGAGLISFIQWMREKGLMKPATAGSWRSAAQALLEIDGEGWEAIDLRTLDVEEQFHRFTNHRGSRYTPGSLNTYGQRFRDAVATYLDYLANPTGFRPPASRTRKNQKSSVRPVAKTDAADERAVSVERTPPGGRDLITYPFPLQSGDLAYVQLPVRVDSSDAERLCAFIRSIAIVNE